MIPGSFWESTVLDDSKEVVSNLSTCVQMIHLTSSVGKKGDLEHGAIKLKRGRMMWEGTVRIFRDDLGLALLTVPPASEAGREITLIDLPDLMSAHTSTHVCTWTLAFTRTYTHTCTNFAHTHYWNMLRDKSKNSCSSLVQIQIGPKLRPPATSHHPTPLMPPSHSVARTLFHCFTQWRAAGPHFLLSDSYNTYTKVTVISPCEVWMMMIAFIITLGEIM